jgi:hypothetical protein
VPPLKPLKTRRSARHSLPFPCEAIERTDGRVTARAHSTCIKYQYVVNRLNATGRYR